MEPIKEQDIYRTRKNVAKPNQAYFVKFVQALCSRGPEGVNGDEGTH